VGAIYTVFPDLDALILEVKRAHHPDLRGLHRGSGGGGEAAREERLVGLATRYLDFAAGHGLRWRALFQHRLAGERPTPDWYMAEQVRLFSYIEEPLGELRPELGPRDRSLLARTLFSAVHGIVSLGLDEKLVAVPVPVLRRQVETVVAALGVGLRGR
jgi:AcrR family transcriptional regulator